MDFRRLGPSPPLRLTGTQAPPASPEHRLSRPSRRVLEPSRRPGQDSPGRRRTPGRTLLPRREQDSSIPRTTWTPSRSPLPRLLHPGRRRCRDQSARRRPARLHEPDPRAQLAYLYRRRPRKVWRSIRMPQTYHAANRADLDHWSMQVLTTAATCRNCVSRGSVAAERSVSSPPSQR